jgi:diguanylate cyclase (GGDEF)-like protein/PAS domain S-box-containing protein
MESEDTHFVQANLASVPDVVHHALSVCGEGVLIVAATAPSFPILYANPAFCRIYGYVFADLVGQPAALLRSAEAKHTLAAIMELALAEAKEQRALVRSLRRNGSEFWNQLTISPVSGHQGGQPGHLVCVVDDVTGERLQKTQLAHLLSHDELTGLPNRSMFTDQLRSAKAHAASRGDTLAVACLSLDGFSLVNESLGHPAGDQFLIAVARRLQGCLRPNDTLARHGGSEFVLLLGEIGIASDATEICAQIMRALAAPVVVAGQTLHAACSVGIARYPQDGDDGVTLLRYADMALSHARGQGGNRYQFFAPEMNQRSGERIQMEAALRIALAEDQLHLLYQPVADLQQGAVCALEALVRWQHPVQGLIDARRFITVAEDTGLTTAIGHWALKHACEDMRVWREAGLAPVKMALNVSPKQFRDPGLAHAIFCSLEEGGLEPELLSIELTEAALMQDPQTGAETLSQLKALGIGLTLDDFGAGYSSLNHLKRFPLDLVKIDSDLTANVDSGSDDAALVKTIIAMAHHLGIQVAAVGVETEAQCDFLRRNMCDQIQGYFFAQPSSAAQVAAMLAAKHSLPPHLLRIQKQKRTLLLVDDEQNIVSALKRLLRRDNYQILTAYSGQEGLDVLAANAVDVIVSDQRMPGMIGADFLRAAKGLYPETIRIMLSGYTELQSVTDAVNEGAIYKFLTKPWDDEQLRGHITEAFRLKEIADDNERLNLELRTANYALASTNRKMEELLRQKQLQITRDEISLNVARELLQFVPLAVIGLDDEGMVAFVNGAADSVFRQRGALLGNEANIVLPELFPNGLAPVGTIEADLDGHRYQVVAHSMGANSQSSGCLITLSPCEVHL